MNTEARLWLTGFAVAAVLLSAIVGALLWNASHAVVPDKECTGTHSANEQSVNLDGAFFQDPFTQTVLLQSMQTCAK
ncbi:hypothetical protein BTH42_09610 [Burkholderia sp. SRS-W-2-2016]|uniref:hypothetical protein n=1 Tax=Burkholderia sp. SRS-W-2-2016 TaxID=1926878 RepID=UPI00094AF55E|nr:hypothetical protein [Burkholderia sp. SRS-W-2-2016]OLL31880.1 hypothetical protein BTH42_09610 [Burkholderia sp. SRS-W-2-2016]